MSTRTFPHPAPASDRIVRDAAIIAIAVILFSLVFLWPGSSVPGMPVNKPMGTAAYVEAIADAYKTGHVEEADAMLELLRDFPTAEAFARTATGSIRPFYSMEEAVNAMKGEPK